MLSQHIADVVPLRSRPDVAGDREQLVLRELVLHRKRREIQLELIPNAVFQFDEVLVLVLEAFEMDDEDGRLMQDAGLEGALRVLAFLAAEFGLLRLGIDLQAVSQGADVGTLLLHGLVVAGAAHHLGGVVQVEVQDVAPIYR